VRLSLSTYTTLSFYSFTFRIECMSITLSSEVVVRICDLSYLIMSTFYLVPENSLIDYELLLVHSFHRQHT
jgi:hypothetical protein